MIGTRFEDKKRMKWQAVYTLLNSTYRPITEAYMKSNKPWTTRTGMAVAGLHSKVLYSDKQIKLVLGHGVHYGVFLEKGHTRKTKSGKTVKVRPYAIVLPTMQKYFPEIARNVQRLWTS